MTAALTPLESREISTLFVEYLERVTDDEQYEGRPPALILTKEDIVNIKRYERHGLNLPINLAHVEQRLRFQHSRVSGLEPDDLLRTYQAINQHAKSWDAIETAMTQVGLGIDSFASTFTDQGGRIIRVIDRMDFATQLDLRVTDITLEIARGIPAAPLNPQDQALVIRLAKYLDEIAADTQKHERDAATLTRHIDVFAHTLLTELIPDVKHKITLAKTSGLDEKIQALDADLERLTQEIDEKTAQIKTVRNNRWYGLFGGAVGYLIADDITGKQAQDIRRKQNTLIKQKSLAIEELASLNPLSSAISELELNLQDMDYRMAGAQASARNLQNLWQALSFEIGQSAERLKKIDNNQDLFDFTYHFADVVRPWANVKSLTTYLLQVQREALEQFNLQQQFPS